MFWWRSKESNNTGRKRIILATYINFPFNKWSIWWFLLISVTLTAKKCTIKGRVFSLTKMSSKFSVRLLSFAIWSFRFSENLFLLPLFQRHSTIKRNKVSDQNVRTYDFVNKWIKIQQPRLICRCPWVPLPHGWMNVWFGAMAILYYYFIVNSLCLPGARGYNISKDKSD